MNEGKISKIRTEEYPEVLWPFINVFNSLQNRLKGARLAESELRRLTQTIMKSTELANQGQFQFNRPTGTLLDEFLAALKRQEIIVRRRGARGEGTYKPASAADRYMEVPLQPTQPQQPIQGEFQRFDMPPFDTSGRKER
ncbi:hypothetical protein KSC_109940 [Ktedonobacter sp. SOSP1-52]|nr:hypothetical protein KSC_109940 [Ktedonobacter sp. SOSP1-52]